REPATLRSLPSPRRGGNATSPSLLLRPARPVPLLQHGRGHHGGPAVLPANSPGVRDEKRSICFVVNTVDDVQDNGGKDAQSELVAHALARAGWHVHILCCEKPP